MRFFIPAFSRMIKMGSKITYPAPERNKSFILDVLRKHFDGNKEGNVLEISSGTGQHVSYFAEHFPLLTFHPSEFDKSLFNSIKAYSCETKTNNVKEPVYVDVTTDCDSWKFPRLTFDYLININMMHIAPFECAVMLFKNAGKLLKPNGVMVTYGPYAYEGVLEPQSNIDFDRNLRAQNASWGVRDVVDLKAIAGENKIELLNTYDLPANNKCLVWKKM